MVKSVLIYGAETCSLYEDDRRRINAAEMDALRRSAGISKLDRKTNEYIRGKINAQDTKPVQVPQNNLMLPNSFYLMLCMSTLFYNRTMGIVRMTSRLTKIQSYFQHMEREESVVFFEYARHKYCIPV